MNAPTHDDHGFSFACLLDRLGDALRILACIAEFERVHGTRIGADLHPAFRIKQGINARTRIDAHMMTAIGADVQACLEVVPIEYRFTGWALRPNPFRHPLVGSTFATAITIDTRWQDLVYPTHCSFPNISGLAGLIT